MVGVVLGVIFGFVVDMYTHLTCLMDFRNPSCGQYKFHKILALPKFSTCVAPKLICNFDLPQQVFKIIRYVA